MAPPQEASGVVHDAWVPGAMRGRDGFFRVGCTAGGAWWLADPAGQPFFVRCVHIDDRIPLQEEGAATQDLATRLVSWGFNAIAVSSGVPRDCGLPFWSVVDFCKEGPLLVAPGLCLPDVFDSGWAKLAEARAGNVCAPHLNNRALIGWVSDENLAWAQSAAGGRPTLLQLCLSLEPGFAAYHAAWEFVLAPYGGRLDLLAGNWGMELRNKEVLREMTRCETGVATRGYHKDHGRWTREFARRYFTATAAAVRAADSNHLILGCRLRRAAGPDVMAKCTYPVVDMAMPDWRDLPPVGPGGAGQPILAGEVCWVGEEFRRAPAGGRGAHLTSLERMLRRARAGLERVARHPAAVGYAWAQWQDEAGEQPPFARGLLHGNGQEAREHTELLAAFNVRADALHRHPSTHRPA